MANNFIYDTQITKESTEYKDVLNYILPTHNNF
jgi:hypothetical protein